MFKRGNRMVASFHRVEIFSYIHSSIQMFTDDIALYKEIVRTYDLNCVFAWSRK